MIKERIAKEIMDGKYDVKEGQAVCQEGISLFGLQSPLASHLLSFLLRFYQ